MFTFEKQKQKFRAWARREIAKEAHTTMLTYQAARQSLDLYEMRLETLDTRLCKRMREMEDRISQLEATVALYAEAEPAYPAQRAG